MNKNFKIFLLIFIPLILYIFLNQFTNSYYPKSNLIIHYINVGQGDSILVQHKNTNILIDSGTKESAPKILKYIKRAGIKKLDYVFLTHPHDDHIGGFPYLLNYLKADKIFSPKVTSNTPSFKHLTKSLYSRKIKLIPVLAPQSISISDNLTINMLSPTKTHYENLNNYSLVFMLQFNKFKFLFTGDAEKEIENEITNYDIDCDVLKVGHHGSKTSSIPSFLNKTTPSIAIISCGLGNDYGHPNENVLKNLNYRNIKIYRTDLHGNIVLVCDKNSMKIYKEKSEDLHQLTFLISNTFYKFYFLIIIKQII